MAELTEGVAAPAFSSEGLDLTQAESKLLSATEQWPSAWASGTHSIFAVRRLERALTAHAAALNRAAEASEKHARSLAWATWVLAITTIALALATVGQYLNSRVAK